MLDVNQAATRIFPLATSPGAHWIYFGLFSTYRQVPRIKPLTRYIAFLEQRLLRRNTGVGIQVLQEKGGVRKIKLQSERAKLVHDIRLRIEDRGERRQVIDEAFLYRLNALVGSRKRQRKKFIGLAREFRKAWCR